MDNYQYQCQYCGIHYTPKRRHKQIYCSSSCRVNSFNRNKKEELKKSVENQVKLKHPPSTEKMSWAGVGNGAAGAIAVNTLTHLLTKEENRPATKKDVREIIAALKQKHFIVKNMQPKPDGSVPFFDIQTCTIIYFKQNKITGNGSI